MKRSSNYLPTCITALLCFGVGFIVSSNLSKGRVVKAQEKAEAGDRIMDGMVSQTRRTFELYHQIRDLQGKLAVAKADRVTVEKLPAPARVVERVVYRAPIQERPQKSQVGHLAMQSIRHDSQQAPKKAVILPLLSMAEKSRLDAEKAWHSDGIEMPSTFSAQPAQSSKPTGIQDQVTTPIDIKIKLQVTPVYRIEKIYQYRP